MMSFYYFGGTFGETHDPKYAYNLEKSNFSGVMYTYDATQGDMLVRVARDIKLDQKIKYLVAIRPYTISPQYLCAVNDSINEIMKDRLQINLIGGYTKDHEAHVGGIIGDVNDQSGTIQKQNYLIKFIDSLNEIKTDKTKLDFFVSTTNEYVFETIKKYNNKIILPYSVYSRMTWTDHKLNKYPSERDWVDLTGVETMVALTPIIRETKEELEKLTNYAIRPVWKKEEVETVVNDVGYFTHETFDDFVRDLEKDNIKYLLINAVPVQENKVIIPFIKDYVEKRQEEEKM
jgi:hypothetical protein